MYGLEKKKDEPFAFDLEEEILKNPQKGKDYLEIANKRIEEIKGKMRKGEQSQHFDQMGTLLHGYSALKKVLSKVTKSKS